MEKNINIEEAFEIIQNNDLNRWEFNSNGHYTSYTVSFNECKNREDAIIAVYKAIKKTGELKQISNSTSQG